MLSMLIAYDATGKVIATLDYVVARDADGNAIGLVDFAAHEAAGGEHLDIWNVSGAVGSKVWPEWLGARAQDFRAEKVGPPGAKWIGALVHRASGYRRERAEIEAAIAAILDVQLLDGTVAKDLRAIVGGPGKSLALDENGRTIGRDDPRTQVGTPAHLPLVAQRSLL